MIKILYPLLVLLVLMQSSCQTFHSSFRNDSDMLKFMVTKKLTHVVLIEQGLEQSCYFLEKASDHRIKVLVDPAVNNVPKLNLCLKDVTLSELIRLYSRCFNLDYEISGGTLTFKPYKEGNQPFEQLMTRSCKINLYDFSNPEELPEFQDFKNTQNIFSIAYDFKTQHLFVISSRADLLDAFIKLVKASITIQPRNS